MSEQPKKARDIKDLKARLGRSPQGATPSMPGSGIPAPMPMPGVAGPGIPRGAEVPAPFAPAPGQRPSGPMQTGRSLRPPSDPFAPPSAGQYPSPSGAPPGAPRPSAAPPGRGPGPAPTDPFAAAQPVAQAREVRLIIDDKAVDDAEVGRKSGAKFAIAALVAAMAGILVGWFVGSTWRERQLYDLVLADAKEIYGTVTGASAKVEQAQKLIDQAAKSAAAGGGKGIEIDFKALEELRKLEKPFPADVFSRKHYRAFEPATVDALFQYYNNTNQLWAKIGTISAKSLTPAGRESLTRAAKAAGDLANIDYGCVPFKDGERFGCGMVTVTKSAGGGEAAPKEEGGKKGKKGKDKEGPAEEKVTVMTRGGQYEKVAFSGQDLSSKPSDYVIVIDKSRSNEILGGATSQFQSFARDLVEAKTLADQTVELQGRLTQQLGNIAKLQSLN